jgi:hypothetical protein
VVAAGRSCTTLDVDATTGTQVACAASSGTSPMTLPVSFTVAAGQTYFIYVDSASYGENAFTLSLLPP